MTVQAKQCYVQFDLWVYSSFSTRFLLFLDWCSVRLEKMRKSQNQLKHVLKLLRTVAEKTWGFSSFLVVEFCFSLQDWLVHRQIDKLLFLKGLGSSSAARFQEYLCIAWHGRKTKQNYLHPHDSTTISSYDLSTAWTKVIETVLEIKLWETYKILTYSRLVVNVKDCQRFEFRWNTTGPVSF